MGADIAGAHARLAAIDPAAPGSSAPLDLLDALLAGAGRSEGLAFDTARPDSPACRGAEAPGTAVAAVAAAIRAGRGLDGHLDAPALEALFPHGAAAPVLHPISAGDETLLLLALPEPPADPVGFASVAAHAASLLLTIRMSDQVRVRDFELKYRVWELESLYDVGLSIAGTLDLESLADDILMKSVSLLNARQGALLVRESAAGSGVLIRNFGGDLLAADTEFDLDDLLVANCVADRVGALVSAPAEKIMAMPIRADDKRVGVLIVADKENRAGGIDDFDEATDGRILRLFGNQAAIALENARLHREAVEKEKMEREVQLAASIQQTILPTTLPEVPGLRLAGGNRPTRQVGGDYFDVFPLPDGRTAFCVADVSGKGVPAALLVSTVHACLHLLVGTTDDLPGLVARTNRHLVRFSSARKFVTLFLAVYDPASRTLRYVNAGHNPGLLLSGAGVALLPSTGVPIGMIPAAVHTEKTVTLAPGDLLVLYSDGITEAIDGAETEYGMDRLTSLVVEAGAEAPAEISRRIFSAVDEFTRGVPQYDDQTVLVARAA